MRGVVSLLLLPVLLGAGTSVQAQKDTSLAADLAGLTDTVGVTGYETAVTGIILKDLAGMHPQQDAMGNITVTFGSGAPRRLIVAPVDEPGYVVSKNR